MLSIFILLLPGIPDIAIYFDESKRHFWNFGESQYCKNQKFEIFEESKWIMASPVLVYLSYKDHWHLISSALLIAFFCDTKILHRHSVIGFNLSIRIRIKFFLPSVLRFNQHYGGAFCQGSFVEGLLSCSQPYVI